MEYRFLLKDALHIDPWTTCTCQPDMESDYRQMYPVPAQGFLLCSLPFQRKPDHGMYEDDFIVIPHII